MTTLPFDRARVISTGQDLLAAEFLRLPLAQRVRLLLSKDVEFFRGEERILTHDAMAALREQTVPAREEPRRDAEPTRS